MVLISNPMRVRDCVKLFIEKSGRKLERVTTNHIDLYKNDVDIIRVIMMGCAGIDNHLIELEEKIKNDNNLDVYMVCDYSDKISKSNEEEQKYK